MHSVASALKWPKPPVVSLAPGINDRMRYTNESGDVPLYFRVRVTRSAP